MDKKMTKHRKIEFVFPVLIFFVFTLSALIVILFAAQIYQHTVADAAMNYNANTSVAYIREKIHQHDNGQIGITTFDGINAIVMREDIAGETYATYIYAHNGALRELFIKNDSVSNFTADSGQKILTVRSFEAHAENDRLLSFSCEDEDGHKASAYVGVYGGDLIIDNNQENKSNP